MDQEHLTLVEQNQLKQDSLPEVQHGEDYEIGGEEQVKTFATSLKESGEASLQQLVNQGAIQQKNDQEMEAIGAPPDLEKDFMGYMQWLGKKLYKQGLLQEKQQSVTAVSEAEQLHSFFQQSVASVKHKYDDFDQAADFIYNVRARQLAACSALYPEMTDQKNVDAVIGNELKQILQECAQKNQNPAEVLYNIAQKIGYTNVPSDTIENLQERHSSARTLAAYNGLTPSSPISLDLLDKMSEAEFSTWIADPKNKAAFNHLMSGGEL
ncbi:hypothetical protein [Bartonella sp. B41]